MTHATKLRASLLIVLSLCLAACQTRATRAASPLDLADAALAAGDLQAAEARYRQLLASPDDAALAHDGLAVVELHRGDSAAAIALLGEGLRTKPPVDPTYARTRLAEDLAWVLMMEGCDARAMTALVDSVAAQGWPPDVAAAIQSVGKARLLLHAGEPVAGRAALHETPTAVAESFVVVAAQLLAVRVELALGDRVAAEAAWSNVQQHLTPDDPRRLEPTLYLAIDQGDWPRVQRILDELTSIDPYAAEMAELSYAEALRKAGQQQHADALMATIGARYLRSAPSASVRRAAAGLRQGASVAGFRGTFSGNTVCPEGG